MKQRFFAIICLLIISTNLIGCDMIQVDFGYETESIKEITEVNGQDFNMQVHFIDVGQADCILIESDNHYMLVDAGNNEDEGLILSYLQEQNVKRLEYVIGTHPHEDHIGSLDAVIRNFDIGKIILPEKEHTTKTFENVLDAIEEKNQRITKPNVGDNYKLGGASFIIVAPNDDYGDELNNWSVGIKVILGDTSFLLCGDAEKEAEKDMLSNGLNISADVLKLGHHGSRTSSSEDFIEAVNPSYVVITCGSENSYGHPHKETMKWLKEKDLTFYRTDEQGTIIATTNGQEITWNIEASKSFKAGRKK